MLNNSDGDCEDEGSWSEDVCKSYKGKGMCETDPSIVGWYCRKTCGFCGKLYTILYF